MNTNSLTPDSIADALATELAGVEEDFNRAMVSNDVLRISACVADDWVLITPEVGVVSRSRLLHVIESGELSHDTMTKDAGRVRVYGDVAVVTARGQNTGHFRGAANQCRRVGDRLYRKVDGRWLCVLTHLTPVATNATERLTQSS